MYKLNFDPVIFSNLKCSGFGAIIRNSAGEVMVGMSAKGPHVCSSEEVRSDGMSESSRILHRSRLF